MHPIRQMIEVHRSGNHIGIPSLCTAHPLVIETAFLNAREKQQPVLIEATCNQVNQYGGYTGMKPVDFAAFIDKLVEKTGLNAEQLILGGDHLGPSPWQSLPSSEAMDKAEVLVRDFVKAGFTKIHLDCSMHLGDDDASLPLPPKIAAQRAARLAKSAEHACNPGKELVYVIGTEVPIPGGAKVHHGIEVTASDAAAETMELSRLAFEAEGLASAWQRVIAQVVQPGVEFGDDFVLDFVPEKAGGLRKFIESQPGMSFEAHSTDYQTGENLYHLVDSHFAILKVGPELTYAYREAIFQLASIENELFPSQERSQLMEVIDQVMIQHPEHWQKYYHGSPVDRAFARKYSLSDRIRYYWPQQEIKAALERMDANLRMKPIPLSLLSQYFPIQYEAIRTGAQPCQPESLISNHVKRVIERYETACGR